ncbi:hypothetical protein C8F04DRAFT_1309212 [Mycena alexandri]|uniref:F-box domain-containing protein n=1 Tax=Mycena alexandri TaxID=1745969 RepID=A0AAD6TA82_9AGAR|nr:hypothetical protein C8F04DRAFT_1309212 [Mycena alexandri]
MTWASVAYAGLLLAAACYFLPATITNVKRSAAAQDCNEDILDLIFALCPPPILAAAGRACKAWRQPAQRALFATISPKWHPGDIEPRWPQLSRSLDESAQLRSYVRYVRILFTRSAELDHFQWLSFLPSQGLNTLVVYGNQDSRTFPALRRLVLSCAAIKSVRSLVLSSPIIGDTAQLEFYLSSCSLEHLGVIFLEAFSTTPMAPKCSTRPIRRLSLQSSDLVDDIPNLIQACSKTLRRLDLNFVNLKPPNRERLTAILAGVPQLEHLFLAWSEYRPIALLDNICRYLPNLRHLRAGACLYTLDLFSNIPPTLKTLHLEYRSTRTSTELFPVEAAIRGLSSHPALERLTLQPHPGSPFVEFPELATACLSRGVHLLVLPTYFRESQLYE